MKTYRVHLFRTLLRSVDQWAEIDIQAGSEEEAQALAEKKMEDDLEENEPEIDWVDGQEINGEVDEMYVQGAEQMEPADEDDEEVGLITEDQEDL